MKKMKLVSALMCGVMAASLLAGCGKASSDTFTVGFDAEFPPYGYMGDDGQYTGFDLELAEEVCRRNNWELVKRYPLPEDIFEGYYVERDKALFTDEKGEKIYRGYTLRNVTKQEIEEVKNERNCFNCVHNGKECNEDTCLCETDRYGNITDSYSGFERIANGKKK
jgi:hypothetical protein